MSSGRPFAKTRLQLGECRCPGTPHSGDWADVKDRFTFGDVRAVAGALARRIFDPTFYKAVAVSRGVVAWNLVELDEKGHPRPVAIDLETVDEMDDRQAAILVDHFDADPSVYADQLRAFSHQEPSQEDGPPNPSGGPSADGPAVTTPQPPTPLPGLEAPAPTTESSPPLSTSSDASSPPSSPTTT